MQSDASFMERALTLARFSVPLAGVNPPVGAIVVKDGVLVGEGFHHGPGTPHAEAAALSDARGRAGFGDYPLAGATLYSTLEPCCHSGAGKRTPPCTEAIIAAGIARVVIGCRDPNPLVAGRGAARLRAAGLRVDEGLLADRAGELIGPFAVSIRLKRPFVHLKWAQSLDGRIACRGGRSRWITNERARELAHGLRGRYDAVMVGAGTVRTDDPALTVRAAPAENPPRARQPLRVVLAGRKPLGTDARLFSDPLGRGTLVLAATGSTALSQAREAGISALELPAEDGLPDLAEGLRALYRIGVGSVLVEGGAGVVTTFLSRALWDRLTVFVAPLLLGAGIDAVGDLGVPSPDRGISLTGAQAEWGAGFFRIDTDRATNDPAAVRNDVGAPCSPG